MPIGNEARSSFWVVAIGAPIGFVAWLAAALIKAAAEKGLLDERSAVLEIMTSLKRAGADFIITYWALELMQWLRG